MNIEAMAAAIYSAMNEGRNGALPWAALADEDSPTHVGRGTIRKWAEAAAAVAIDFEDVTPAVEEPVADVHGDEI